jgi:hypothetical protein
MKKPGSGEYRAAGPAESTTPSPPPDDLSAKIAEVVSVLGRFGEIAAELRTLFQATRLAQLTLEHKSNVNRAKRIADRRWLGDHEMRLRETERLQEVLRAELDAIKAHTAAE